MDWLQNFFPKRMFLSSLKKQQLSIKNVSKELLTPYFAQIKPIRKSQIFDQNNWLTPLQKDKIFDFPKSTIL